jgi:hypothetical protein
VSAQAWALRTVIRMALEGCPISRIELHRFALETGIEDLAALKLFLDRNEDTEEAFTVERRAERVAA